MTQTKTSNTPEARLKIEYTCKPGKKYGKETSCVKCGWKCYKGENVE